MSVLEKAPTLRLLELGQRRDGEAQEWVGRTEGGRVFYARHSHGLLSWGFGRTLDVAMNAATVAQSAVISPHGGVRELETSRLCELLSLAVLNRNGRRGR